MCDLLDEFNLHRTFKYVFPLSTYSTEYLMLTGQSLKLYAKKIVWKNVKIRKVILVWHKRLNIDNNDKFSGFEFQLCP